MLYEPQWIFVTVHEFHNTSKEEWFRLQAPRSKTAWQEVNQMLFYKKMFDSNSICIAACYNTYYLALRLPAPKMVSFFTASSWEKDTIFGAARKIFGRSYFVTALQRIWLYRQKYLKSFPSKIQWLKIITSV